MVGKQQKKKARSRLASKAEQLAIGAVGTLIIVTVMTMIAVLLDYVAELMSQEIDVAQPFIHFALCMLAIAVGVVIIKAQSMFQDD